MPGLTIKMVQTQEGENGTEVYIVEIPAVAVGGVALVPAPPLLVSVMW